MTDSGTRIKRSHVGRSAVTPIGPASVRSDGAMTVEIAVSAVLEATPEEVWAALEHIETHVEWMADAESIRFVSSARKGVGAEFECTTRIGPIRLVDVMSVTEWHPGAAMGVAHRGVVKGQGRFVLEGLGCGQTQLSWRERLAFPWWLGGVFGEFVAKPILERIWRGNLRRLGTLVVDA